MRKKQYEISRFYKKAVIVLVCGFLFTANINCGDSGDTFLLGLLGYLGYKALQNSNDGDDSAEEEKEKIYCSNFISLSVCYAAAPSPDTPYWAGCATAYAFCCDYTFKDSVNITDYENACEAVKLNEVADPVMSGSCEVCRDYVLQDASSLQTLFSN